MSMPSAKQINQNAVLYGVLLMCMIGFGFLPFSQYVQRFILDAPFVLFGFIVGTNEILLVTGFLCLIALLTVSWYVAQRGWRRFIKWLVNGIIILWWLVGSFLIAIGTSFIVEIPVAKDSNQPRGRILVTDYFMAGDHIGTIYIAPRFFGLAMRTDLRWSGHDTDVRNPSEAWHVTWQEETALLDTHEIWQVYRVTPKDTWRPEGPFATIDT